jgi:hypothetical protein
MIGTWISVGKGWYWPCSAQKMRTSTFDKITDERTEQLGETSTTGEEEASRGIEIRTELSESCNLTVLGKVELKRTSELLHDLAITNS